MARRAERVRVEIVPQIEQLSLDEPLRAVRLARDAEAHAPDAVARAREGWLRISFATEPPGAEVSIRDYLDVNSGWERIGQTPLEYALPAAHYRVRVVRDGYLPVETTAPPLAARVIRLARPEDAPPSMVFVPGGTFRVGVAQPVELPDFWIDAYEVTNREYKRFLDAGGYRDPQYWRELLQDGAAILPFEAAMSRFRDATGRTGPATWELETYPAGQEDFPVRGISWFEAAAYAAFAGKALPTLHQWHKAAGTEVTYSNILRLSNFDGVGPSKAGDRRGLSPWGTYDMAGNVKEWVSNGVSGRPLRYILGGAWNEPAYQFVEPDAHDPWRREPTFGVRLVKNDGRLQPAALEPIARVSGDPKAVVPVARQEVESYKRFYQYDRTALNERVDAVDDTSEDWRKETVSFDAAYGGERIPAYLFLPRKGTPPFQTIVLFPSAYAINRPTSAHLDFRQFDFIIRSGRALLYPVYQGTFERRRELQGPSAFRDMTVQQVKDFFRAVDYLITRSDVDAEKLGYYSVSMGAYLAPVPLALEPRIKTAVLVSGGLRYTWPPEIQPANFAPEVTIPVLLVNGRDDFDTPAPARDRFIELLGTPAAHKRIEVLDGGHFPHDLRGLVRHTLDWFDKYLGPVQ